MTLKRKIAINIAIAFSVLYGLLALLIYVSFASFRREEFRNRLEDKALTTTNLLFQIRQIDRQLLRLIDQNTINKLYNEKTLVFDQNYRLIYSSIDDASIKWDKSDLIRLKEKKKTFKTVDEKEVFGIFYDFEKEDYYVLIAAEDKYGHQQADYLLKILLFSFLGGTTLVWFSTYAFTRKQLKPLDDFQREITSVSAGRLDNRLDIGRENDEIAVLTEAFNEMLTRIDAAYNGQKEFTANASHELRTPISRLVLQMESLMRQPGHSAETLAYLKNMGTDLEQLRELIQSLLIMARMNEQQNEELEPQRIDEIIFDALQSMHKNQPDFHMNFEIAGGSDVNLEIKGRKSLLEIVFLNLFRNAYLYSEDHAVNVMIYSKESGLEVVLENTGKGLTEAEHHKIFEPFVRGKNATTTQGSGLGLRIVKRILDYHNATISYVSAVNEHQFILNFPQAN